MAAERALATAAEDGGRPGCPGPGASQIDSLLDAIPIVHHRDHAVDQRLAVGVDGELDDFRRDAIRRCR